MRHSIALLLALPLAVPAQAPEPTLRTTTSEVLLDVVVRDKHAKIIHDLRPDEVQVFEDGVLQKMRHFEFVDGRSPTPPPPAPLSVPLSTATAPLAANSTVNELRDISVISVVIANLDPRGRKLTLDTMKDFIKDQMRPNTYVGVFWLTLGGLRVVEPYTNDAAKISVGVERAVGGVTFAVPSYDDPGSEPAAGLTSTGPSAGTALALDQLMESSWLNRVSDVYADSMNFLTPLHDFVQKQAEIPGRKVVLLFSAGLPVHYDSLELLKSVISAANRSNVSIYALDTSGYTEQSSLETARRMLRAAAQATMRQQLGAVSGGDMSVTPLEALAPEIAEGSIHADTNANLAQLADGTGGALLPGSLDLREPLRRAMEEVQTHYELIYAPENTAMDGTFRHIEVKVARSGARVYARNGYYALPELNGLQVYPFEIETLKALSAKPNPRQFDFRAGAMQFRPGPERIQLAFVFQAPAKGLAVAKDGRWARVHVSVTALIKDDQGRVVEKISRDLPYEAPEKKRAELQGGTLNFTAPFLLAPGNYTLETAAVDRESMKSSVSRSPLVVERVSGLSMSDIAVARRVDTREGTAVSWDPFQAHDGMVTPELSRLAMPETDGTVKFYAIAYPPAPVDAPINASLEIWRRGKLLIKSPATAVPLNASGDAPMLASLAVTKLLAGHYEAHVLFQYKDQEVIKTLPFTLTGGSSRHRTPSAK